MRNREQRRASDVYRHDATEQQRTDESRRGDHETARPAAEQQRSRPRAGDTGSKIGNSDTGSKIGSNRSHLPEHLVVVSNRQPYRHAYDSTDDSSTNPDEAGSISVDEPTGGLTAGLDPVLQRTNGTWIAWGDGDADGAVTDERDCVGVPPGDERYTLRRIWLSEEAVDAYYYGFSNQVLWPVCHGFTDRVRYRPAYFEWYQHVNEVFAAAAVEHVRDDSVLWIQDYHFALAPRQIRERIPESVPIAQFWHIPWPRPAIFDRCPHARDLLEGLLGNDLLGFHIEQYVDRFLDCVSRLLPSATVDRERRRIAYDGRVTRLTAVPMGVDAEAIDRRARSASSNPQPAHFSEWGLSDDTIVGLGVDRLDYTKGIPERLQAVERFFERNPGWHGRFTFVQKSSPSRTTIPAYRRLGEQVRDRVRRINDRFGSDGWQPIVYTEAHLDRSTLAALYRRGDLLLVNPLCDGMNLVAQEYVAASADETGTLILSERTGVHERLGSHAITIDPESIEETAQAIEQALTEPESVSRNRMRELRRRVFDSTLEWWMQAQFDDFHRLRERHLDAVGAGVAGSTVLESNPETVDDRSSGGHEY